jgi:hypothetical protein
MASEAAGAAPSRPYGTHHRPNLRAVVADELLHQIGNGLGVFSSIVIQLLWVYRKLSISTYSHSVPVGTPSV